MIRNRFTSDFEIPLNLNCKKAPSIQDASVIQRKIVPTNAEALWLVEGDLESIPDRIAIGKTWLKGRKPCWYQ